MLSATSDSHSFPSIFSITAAKRLLFRRRRRISTASGVRVSNFRSNAAETLDGSIDADSLSRKKPRLDVTIQPTSDSATPTHTPSNHTSSRRKSNPFEYAASVFTSIASPLEEPVELPIGNSHFAAITDYPPPGFFHAGNLNPFGLDIPAKLYQLLGSENVESDVKELVHLAGDVQLKHLLRELEGEHLGEVQLRGGKFTYHTGVKSSGEEAGLWFSASVGLDGGLRHVQEILRGVFGIEKGEIELRGFLGKDRDWKAPLRLENFSLSSVLKGIMNESSAVNWTKVSVVMNVERKEGHIGFSGYDIGVEFSGDVAMKLPGSAVPLTMAWTMKEEAKGVWTLRVSEEKEEERLDIIGFKGLQLEDIGLVAHFPVGRPISEVSFQVDATLYFGRGILTLKGVFSANDFYVQSKVPVCTLEDIREFYTSMTGRELEPFNHAVKFKDINFRIDSTGLVFSGAVSIDGHQSVKSNIQIKRDGISITGAVVDIQLGEVIVENGQLDIFIGRTTKNETSRESRFRINGKVTFHHLEFDVAVYTSWSEGEGVQWTVYAELEGTGMKLNRLAPDVEGTWLDLELKQVAFIASNTDSPQGTYNVFDYPVRKGIQFCAAIDRIEPLERVTKSEVYGLTLRAAWASERGFSFGIILPTPIGIHLTKNITSGPIQVEIVANKTPQLQFTASLNVAAPRQTQPLVFTFGLKADINSAEGFGQMTNYWVNPFGISEKVKIGPNMAIEVGIIYAVLAATGTPSSIGFSGGMAIGDVEAQTAMVISENPADELIKASLTELSLQDLVKFASEISGEEIPLPPLDILSFRNILFYLSTGTSVGTTYYPAGASMIGEMDFFGQTTSLECRIGSTTRIAAQFEALQVGPLTVSGIDGKSSSTVIELSAAKQHILIDGAVKIFDLEASIHGVFDILPVPNMAFNLRLAFADALEISLSAKVIGIADFKNLAGADFMVHAILEQEILEYLVKQIRYYLTALLRFMKNGIEAAREFIDTAQEAIESAISSAAEALRDAKLAWREKEAEVYSALKSVQDEFEDGIRELQEDLFGTEKEVQERVFTASKELEQAKMQGAAAVTEAAAEVRRQKAQLGKKINTKLQEVREIKERTKINFGNLKEKIKKEEARVRTAQSWFDECNTLYNIAKAERGRAHFYRKLDLFVKTHDLRHTRDGALAELNKAKAVLEAARAAAESPEYTALQRSKTEKKEELRRARRFSERAIREAEEDLGAHTAAVEAVVRYHEEKVAKEQASDRVQAKEHTLEAFKSEKAPLVEELKTKATTLAETDQFRGLTKAEETLKKATAAKIDVSATKSAVEGLKVKSPKDVGTLERILDGIDDVVDIERVELRGSLRALVTQGKPLQARARIVVCGRKIDLELDYGIADAAGFVRSMLEGVWDGVKDVFEGDDDGGRVGA